MIEINYDVRSTMIKKFLKSLSQHSRIHIVIVKGGFSSVPAKNRLDGKELIVIVQSRPYEFETRQSIRRTWGKFGKKSIRQITFYIK